MIYGKGKPKAQESNFNYQKQKVHQEIEIDHKSDLLLKCYYT